MCPKVKVENYIKVDPRRLGHKIEQIKLHLIKETVVNIDKSLKRIYSITN